MDKKENAKFTKKFMPMFRDADARGLIGARAYVYYFQDIATEHLYHMGKGNDTLPEQYGMAWIYTKYRLHIWKQTDFSRPLCLETWIEKQDRLRIWQDLKISDGSEICALGRLESCVFHLAKQTIGRLSEIEMPADAVCGERPELAPFARIEKETEGMEYVYSHIVRYSDLDKSRHMANLRYINLMENAFTPEFHMQHSIKDLELHYIAQCFCGDEIRVYKKADGCRFRITGAKADGTVVFTGILEF